MVEGGARDTRVDAILNATGLAPQGGEPHMEAGRRWAPRREHGRRARSSEAREDHGATGSRRDRDRRDHGDERADDRARVALQRRNVLELFNQELLDIKAVQNVEMKLEQSWMDISTTDEFRELFLSRERTPPPTRRIMREANARSQCDRREQRRQCAAFAFARHRARLCT